MKYKGNIPNSNNRCLHHNHFLPSNIWQMFVALSPYQRGNFLQKKLKKFKRFFTHSCKCFEFSSYSYFWSAIPVTIWLSIQISCIYPQNMASVLFSNPCSLFTMAYSGPVIYLLRLHRIYALQMRIFLSVALHRLVDDWSIVCVRWNEAK